MANDCLSRLNNICRNLVASFTTLPHYPMTWSAGSTGVDRWGTGGTRPPTFQLGGDDIGNVPPPLFCLKSGKSHVFCLLLTYIRCQPA